MSANKNKLDKVHSSKLFKSVGCDSSGFKVFFGEVNPSTKQSIDNPAPRIVCCLGCSRNIWPQEDCWGLSYKGHPRYICRKCYVEHGFIW